MTPIRNKKRNIKGYLIPLGSVRTIIHLELGKHGMLQTWDHMKLGKGNTCTLFNGYFVDHTVILVNIMNTILSKFLEFSILKYGYRRGSYKG